jgi:hypothetical protein
MDDNSINKAVKQLFALLLSRQIEFLLVGGVAVLSYVEGRNTQDLDLIVALPALKKLPEIQIATQDQYFGRGNFEGLQLDLLLTANPVFAKVMQKYATHRLFVEQAVPTATVEGLVLLKLYALPSLYRQGDFGRVGLYENDLATLIYQYHPDLAALLYELSPFVTGGDMDEIQHILAEIQQRITRFKTISNYSKESTDPRTGKI